MKFFQNLILIIILSNINSEEINVNVTFEQIENANFKITLSCVNQICSSLVGTAILPYSYDTNKTSQIRLNHISLAKNAKIERNIYIPVHNKELTFSSPFKIGNKNVNYEGNKITIYAEMPTIDSIKILNEREGPLILEIQCSKCNEKIFIPEGTEIPDDTFYLSSKKNDKEERAYLRSCTSMSELKSNTSTNITCIPFLLEQ